MAKTNEGEGGGSGPGTLKVLVAAVVLVAVGAVVGGKVLGGSAATAATAGPTTTTEPLGPVTAVESITVNLADGRFLKLGLAFEVHPGQEYPLAEGEVEVDELTGGFAREIDASIMVLSTFTYEQLVAPDGKAAAKQRLLERLGEVSNGAISDVLFHEFVMQ